MSEEKRGTGMSCFLTKKQSNLEKSTKELQKKNSNFQDVFDNNFDDDFFKPNKSK